MPVIEVIPFQCGPSISGAYRCVPDSIAPCSLREVGHIIFVPEVIRKLPVIPVNKFVRRLAISNEDAFQNLFPHLLAANRGFRSKDERTYGRLRNVAIADLRVVVLDAPLQAVLVISSTGQIHGIYPVAQKIEAAGRKDTEVGPPYEFPQAVVVKPWLHAAPRRHVHDEQGDVAGSGVLKGSLGQVLAPDLNERRRAAALVPGAPDRYASADRASTTPLSRNWRLAAACRGGAGRRSHRTRVCRGTPG